MYIQLQFCTRKITTVNGPNSIKNEALTYLSLFQSRNEDVVGYLIFLFQLTFSTLGKVSFDIFPFYFLERLPS